MNWHQADRIWFWKISSRYSIRNYCRIIRLPLLKNWIKLANRKRNTILFILLGLGLITLFLVNISFGSVTIPFKEVFSSLTGGQATKSTWEYIIINYRLPKAITAILVGMGLSISGLLMQTLFRNPLAGPDVLGLSSGASLSVAFVILGAGLLPPFLRCPFHPSL